MLPGDLDDFVVWAPRVAEWTLTQFIWTETLTPHLKEQRVLHKTLPIQKRQRSKLHAPRSQTISPAPLSALPLQTFAPLFSLLLTQKSSPSPLPIQSHETTYSTPDSDAISGLPFRTKSQSQIPQVNSSYVSFPTPPPMAPKTLKDVTRYLRQNREITQTHYSFSDSDSRSDGFLDDSKSSCSHQQKRLGLVWASILA